MHVTLLLKALRMADIGLLIYMNHNSEQSQGEANIQEQVNIQEQIPYQLNESGLDTHHSEDSEFQQMANEKIEKLEKIIQQQGKRIESLEKENDFLKSEINRQGKRIESLEKENDFLKSKIKEQREIIKQQQRKIEKYEENLSMGMRSFQNTTSILRNNKEIGVLTFTVDSVKFVKKN